MNWKGNDNFASSLARPGRQFDAPNYTGIQFKCDWYFKDIFGVEPMGVTHDKLNFTQMASLLNIPLPDQLQG